MRWDGCSVACLPNRLKPCFRSRWLGVKLPFDMVPVEPRWVSLRNLPLEGVACHHRHSLITQRASKLGGSDAATDDDRLIDSPAGVKPIPDVFSAVDAASPVGNPVAISVTDGEHTGWGVDQTFGRYEAEAAIVSLLDRFNSRPDM